MGFESVSCFVLVLKEEIVSELGMSVGIEFQTALAFQKYFLLKLEGMLTKRLGVCSRDRKKVVVFSSLFFFFFSPSGSERAGRSIGCEKRRQVRRKSAFQIAKTEGGNLVCWTVFMVISLTINFTSIISQPFPL